MKFKRLFFLFLIILTILGNINIVKGENLNAVPNQTQPAQNSLALNSEAAILIDNKTGKVLYSLNSDKKMYPASTTKILTAILTIEKGNLSDTVTVSKTAISGIPSGYSSAYLTEGEQITVENLLYALLVHSANEAGNVLAEYVSNSIEDFVVLMNEKVNEIGCKNTHFVNTNGIHDDNHYTTAYDLALITRYCMNNKTFRKFVSTQKCTIPATNKYPERVYINTNDLINPTSKYYYNGCIGVKTGYTTPAKNCLISACNKNGLQLIAVVLGATQTTDHLSARYVDSKILYDYGYSTFSMSKIASKNTVIDNIEIENASNETKNLDLTLEDDINALVSSNSNISYEISLNDNLVAPIASNSVVGTVTYTVDNIKYSDNLLASHEVEKKASFIGIFRIIFVIILLFLIFIFLSKILRKKGKHY